MEKRIAIVAGDKVHDVVIQPGTTGREVLSQLGLPAEFDLMRRDGLQVAANEILWDGIEDGDKLTAAPPARVG